MVTNEYAKAASICSGLSEQAAILAKAVEELLSIKSRKESAGYDLTDNGFEAYMGNGSLKFIADGTDWNNVMASAATLKTWLVDNGHWGVFQKVRP